MATSQDKRAPADARMALPQGVVANAAYESRVPEPPPIAIDMFDCTSRIRRPRNAMPERPFPDPRPYINDYQRSALSVKPNPAMATAVGLTPAQVYEITGDCRIEAPSILQGIQGTWKYDMRYQAQPVLEYLYLGPYTVARDTQFLTGAGITMLLVVRDTSQVMMARLLDMGKVAQDQGLALHSVDVSSPAELIQALPGAVKAINDHMLRARRDDDGVSTGRVLVLCETGNGRSASVVVAYVMAMYGLHLADALAYINHRRFCMNLGEDAKNMLMSYGDILLAQSDVARHTHIDGGSINGPQTGDANASNVLGKRCNDGTAFLQPLAGASPVASRHPSRSSSPLRPLPSDTRGSSLPAKRSIQDSMEMDEDSVECADGSLLPSTTATDMDQSLDRERFQNRRAFTPFADTDMA